MAEKKRESFIELEKQRKKEKAARDAAEKKRRAESKAAYESSGAAKQIERAKKKDQKPKVKSDPGAWQKESSGSIKGKKAKKDFLDSL